MKPFTFSRIALLLLGFGLAGCKSEKNTTHLGGGYEEIAHPYHVLLDEPPPPRTAFQHRASDGTVTKIWSSLYGVPEVIHGDVAIFVGDKAYADPEKNTRPRLFAVKSPELPLDITDEVLWRWAKAANQNFATAVKRCSLTTPLAVNGRLEVRLEFYTDDKDWPEKSALFLEWQQVADLMLAVKQKGTLQKDLHWHTPYIEEKF